MEFELVFDIVNAGYKSWSFPAFGIVFIIIGSIMVKKAFTGNSNMPAKDRKTPPRLFSILWLSFAVLWTSSSFVSTFTEYRGLRNAYIDGQAEYVEGTVVDFNPMPFGGHQYESFTVDGVSFEYSDFVVVAGFNNTKSHGGPIDEGAYVKIWYVSDGFRNNIVRLEVEKLKRQQHLTTRFTRQAVTCG
jgi:hypothetical protein